MPLPKYITTHRQACACAFLNVRVGAQGTLEAPGRIPFDKARAVAKFSILTEDAAIGRLIRMECRS